MIYYVTPREDHSRYYDVIQYDSKPKFWHTGILKGDVFGDTMLVDRRQFGQLMKLGDWNAITLASRRSQKHAKKYNAIKEAAE